MAKPFGAEFGKGSLPQLQDGDQDSCRGFFRDLCSDFDKKQILCLFNQQARLRTIIKPSIGLFVEIYKEKKLAGTLIL